MRRQVILAGTVLVFSLAIAALVPAPAPAQETPAFLAEQDMTAESRGDVGAALALYGDDAIIQGGGLCWTPCVGKAAIRKELERRVSAKNHATIVGKYVSANVAVVKSEVRLGSINKSGALRKMQWSPGVDRIIVWNIYEERRGKIAVVTLVGQRTDPQTALFIRWLGAFKAK